jgi:hypothetical protein
MDSSIRHLGINILPITLSRTHLLDGSVQGSDYGSARLRWNVYSSVIASTARSHVLAAVFRVAAARNFIEVQSSNGRTASDLQCARSRWVITQDVVLSSSGLVGYILGRNF